MRIYVLTEFVLNYYSVYTIRTASYVAVLTLPQKSESCSISAEFLPYASMERHGSAILPFNLYCLSEPLNFFFQKFSTNFPRPTLFDDARYCRKLQLSGLRTNYMHCTVPHGHTTYVQHQCERAFSNVCINRFYSAVH